MKADIFLPNVEFYGAESGQVIRVKIGERFRVVLDETNPVVWATTKDPVFSVSEFSGNTVDVEATAQGKSEIQVQVNRQVVFYLDLEVYSQEAASLNPTAGSPELK